MSGKPEIESRRAPARRRLAASRGKIGADLQARGIDAPLADRLARQVARQLEGRDAAAYEATLDGIALALCATTIEPECSAGTGSNLQEVERLMGAFATELGKLDEVLEVLAAYLRRMRVASVDSDGRPRVLH